MSGAVAARLAWTRCSAANGHAGYALTSTDALPGGVAAAWLTSWMFYPAVFGVPSLLVLLFPDGRLPSRRWRLALALTAVAASCLAAGIAFAPGRLADSPVPEVENPLGLGEVSILRAMEATIALFATRLNALAPILVIAAFCAIPIATTIAISRHRLYDIDVVVNRALVYGSLTATLAGTYLGSVLVLQRVLSPLTEQSDLAVAGSTLAVAALFGPARRRIQSLVDRSFYRRRYDGAQTLDNLASRLRHRVDLDAVGADLRGAVPETVQPAHVSSWLRE